MERERAPTPISTLPEPSEDVPEPKWKNAVRRFAIAIACVAAALTSLALVLSYVSHALLTQALVIFFGWSLPLQSLAVLVSLIIIGLLAGSKQVYQALQNRQQQENVREGVEGVETWLARIYGLLASLLTRDPASLSGRRKSNPVIAHIPDPPPLRETGQTTRKLQDEVQLVAPTRFIGRAEDIDWLTDRLLSHRPERDTTVLHGINGIGKTALAAYVIETVTTRHQCFTDGIARVPCDGKQNALQVVRHVLERVDRAHRLPATEDLDVLQQVSEELLADKAILIVLDGVGSNIPLDVVVRALRTQHHSAHILITTTVQPSLDVAPVENQRQVQPLTIVRHPDGTETDEALELFAHYAGKASARDFGHHIVEAKAIVEALERHTYALKLVGGYLRVLGDMLWPLAAEIQKLKDGEIPPEMSKILRPVWVATTTTVNALPDDARKLLFAFGAFGTEEAGREAVHALGDELGLHDTSEAIYTLVQHQLMESFYTPTMPEDSDSHRLRIHTLLHVYIAMRVRAPEWQAHYARAKDIIAERYAQFVQRYDRHDPTRNAQRALTADAENVARALDWAIDHNQHDVIVRLAHGMRRYWHDRWMNGKTLYYVPIAVDAAVTLAGEARMAKNVATEKVYLERAADLAFTLGRVQRRVGHLAEAEPLFKRDLRFRREHRPRDYAAEAQALHQLAQLERSRGNMRKALRYCRQGLAIIRWHGRPGLGRGKKLDETFAQAKGLLLAQKGRIERSRGNLRIADKHFTEALKLFEQTGDLLEQGVAWGYKGRIARVFGDVPTARDYFERSNDLARQAFDFRGQGIIATQLGRIARIQGDLDAAEHAFTEGLKKALQVQDRQAEAVNLNYLGRIARSRGKPREAEEYYTRSLEVAQEINDRLDIGLNFGYLGRIARERKLSSAARENLMKSLRILREVEDRRGQALILAELALVELQDHRYWRARWRLWRGLRLIRAVGDKRSEGNILRIRGQLYFERGNLSAARAQFIRARARAESVDDPAGVEEAQRWLDKADVRRERRSS